MTRFRHDLILRMIKLLDAVLVTIPTNAQIITCVRTSSASLTGVFPCSIHADTHLRN